MNRTMTLFAVAAALVLTAVVLGFPRGAAVPSPPAGEPVRPGPSTPAAAPGSLSLTGKLSHPYVLPGRSDVFATLTVTAQDVPGAERAPVNFALVLDRSGSMAGEKLRAARNAAERLVELLGERDRLAIIHYGNDVRTLPGRLATPQAKEEMRAFIRAIRDEGGTNIGEGLGAGLRELARGRGSYAVNRLLLLSDGQPTVGLVAPDELLQLARTVRAQDISLTALGVGADFNEQLMTALAEVGGGSYGFIADERETAALFEKDLQRAGRLVARDVRLRLDVPPGATFGEVLGRAATTSGRSVEVALPDLSARQVEQLVVRFTVDGQAEGRLDVSSFSLAYQDVLTGRAAAAGLALSALVTRDASLAEAGRDKAAFVTAAKAKAAQNYQAASAALAQGNLAEAQRSLEQNRALLDEAAGVGGAGAVQEEKADLDYFFGLTAGGRSDEERKLDTKAIQKKSLKGFGRGDSVY